MTKEKQPSIEWGRIYHLPYNHYFKEAVKKARKSLGLCEEGITNNTEARRWLHEHLGLQTPLLPNVDHIPLWVVLLPSSYEGTKQTKVSLWQYSKELADEFHLPVRMYKHIGLFIVTNNETLLTSWTGLDVMVAPDRSTGTLQFSVAVEGIDNWTTQKQWTDAWKTWVQVCQEILGPIHKGHRRTLGLGLKERMTRWSQWNQISIEKHTKNPEKILRVWEDGFSHQPIHHYDASEVAYALDEIEKLSKPKSFH